MAARILQLTVLLLSASGMMCKVLEHTRGLKTYNLKQDEVHEILKRHDPQHINEKHRHKKHVLANHDEVKKFLDWKAMHKDGHPAAGAAFAGKLPHDFIPHITDEAFHDELRNHDHETHGSLHEDHRHHHHLYDLPHHDEL